MRWHDLNFSEEGAYSMFPCYGQSKLANILFTRELDRRLISATKRLNVESTSRSIAVAVHPGCVRTEFTRNMAWYMQVFT
jgi:NAD(P)-dependent dehydrogenase (short-subunit alcohol dehydrogenase family)